MSSPPHQTSLEVPSRDGQRSVGCSIQDWRSGARPRCLVVLPTFNAERWIDRCLAALDANTEPHDLLVIDDASRSPLSEIVVGASNRVLATMHENVGLIASLNFAAEFCLREGYEFYVRQDADDLPRSDRLAKQRLLADETQAALITSRARIVDENGAVLWRSPPVVPPDRAKSALRYSNPYFHSSWFLPARTLREAGLYNPDLDVAEDYELLFRIAHVGDVVTSEEELIDYTVHSGSRLSADRRTAFMVLRIRARYFEWRSPAGWYGLGRGVAALLAPRRWKTWARSKLGERRARA